MENTRVLSTTRVYVKTLKFCLNLGYKLSKNKTPETGKWVRNQLVEMGPTYIKLGQVVSSRTDLFPSYITDELKDLQANVPPISFEDIERVMREELRGDWSEHFAYLSRESIASASIGQVHLGVLKNKRKVVVKVQKPEVEENIQSELNAILSIARGAKMLNNKRVDDVLLVVEEVYKNIQIETDFNIERKNMVLFSRMMKNADDVIIPRVYNKLSSKRLLVMEYVPGISVYNANKMNINGNEMSRTVMTTFIKTLLQYGYLHADPHAGNVALREDGSFILYDFGIVAKYDLKLKAAFREILIGFLSRDANSVIDILLTNDIVYVRSKGKSVNDISDLEYVVLFKVVTYLFDYSQKVDVDELTNNILADPFLDVDNLPFMFDSKMIILFKTMTTLEGVCKTLDPEFNYYQLINELFDDFLDVNVMMNKVVTDINYVLSQLSKQYAPSRSEIPREKMSNAKAEMVNNDLDDKYALMLVSIVLSIIANIMI